MRRDPITDHESDLITDLPTSPSAGQVIGTTFIDAYTGEHHTLFLATGELTPRQVAREVGLSPYSGSNVHLLDSRGKMKRINLDDQINVSGSQFKLILSPPNFSAQFLFNDQKFESFCRYVSGSELATIIGGNLEETEIWCEWHSGKKKQRVLAETVIDLLDGNLKRIFDHRQVKQNITIIVNGRRRFISSYEICFEDLTRFAFDGNSSANQTIYTVTYLNGPPDSLEGSLIDGECVSITEGMIFNVTQTDKS